MKKIIATMAGLAVLGLTFTATRAFADDKEVTINGNTKCSMCSLHEGKECTPVIQTKKDGKTVNYYVVDNDASKKLEKLCHKDKKVTVTGTVKEVDGKQKLTVTKVEVEKG
jgi:type 1 fimbria pilin